MDFKNIEIHIIKSCTAQKAVICECSFTDSDIHSCFMDHTRVSGSRWGNASFKQMFMEKSLFDDVNLNGSSFLNLALLDTEFEKSILNGSKFQNLAMENCEFNNISLSGSKFNGANFSGVELDSSCIIEGMKIDGIPVEELLKLYNEKNDTKKG